MKLNDIANQLRLLVPQYTSKFSDYLTASSITSNGSLTTIVFASAHGLTTGQWLILNGIGRKTAISAVAVDGLQFTFESARHDLTMNWYRDPNDRSSLNQVRLGGFTNSAWNTTHTLAAVPNREHFTVKSALASPTLNGNEYLLEIAVGGLSGNKQITVVNSTTVTISGTITAGTYLGGTISKMPRISVALTLEDAWKRIITPLPTNSFAMVVVPKDPIISKDRSSENDAIATRMQGADFRLKLLDGFLILMISPTHEELAGAISLDVFRHDMRPVVYKCIMGLTPPTGTSQDGQYKIVPVTDGVRHYDGARLIYEYEFQYPFDLTIEDCVPPSQTSAFRDIDLTEVIGDNMTANIDLDDEPLD